MNELLDFVHNYDMQNIIAIVALILAYLAYRKSIVDGYSSWLDLIKSFKAELDYARLWIGGSYSGSALNEWEDPTKLVYPFIMDPENWTRGNVHI